MQIFIICGYGIPTSIETDRSYQTYLAIVFNTIYEIARNKSAMIIPCGGPTKCDPPFTGTEAELIAGHLSHLVARNEVKRHTLEWKILSEDQSLSTLENLLFSEQLIQAHNLTGTVTIFCEKTREVRLKIFADHIFGIGVAVVQAIDFDLTKNRYLDQEVLAKKEGLALKEGLWTLEEPTRIQKHHEFFQKKFEFLRRRQSEGLSHIDAVTEWFQNEKNIIRELMPDHPLLKEFTDH
ncbi:MAG: hypothetical protein A2017_16300 [Lentisphaerae bacterium GWF2_44_16]|nr:MAG: hypothetical protein A2017_16300 [Lentisphaerae bacterium GWF2_44_16]HAU66158.1 hypothetical protein [Candidatus Uhrbacteria bacterium]